MDDRVEAGGKRRMGPFGLQQAITRERRLGCEADRDSACHAMVGSTADFVHTEFANTDFDSDGDGPC